MSTLLHIVGATLVVGLLSLVGAISLFISRDLLKKILLVLVGFSAGALLSGAFFHLLSESIEETAPDFVFGIMFLGFIVFFILERFFHWHHCHEGECNVHAFSYLILIGDGIHNFIDGLVIAASFLVDTWFGIVTTVMIIGHELPQELGDFGVLVYGGFSRTRALAFNLISQLTAVVGGVVGFFFLAGSGLTSLLLPFAAGGFIYIAASDLVPELHKEGDIKKVAASFVFFLLGIGFMLGIKMVSG